MDFDGRESRSVVNMSLVREGIEKAQDIAAERDLGILQGPASPDQKRYLAQRFQRFDEAYLSVNEGDVTGVYSDERSVAMELAYIFSTGMLWNRDAPRKWKGGLIRKVVPRQIIDLATALQGHVYDETLSDDDVHLVDLWAKELGFSQKYRWIGLEDNIASGFT